MVCSTCHTSCSREAITPPVHSQKLHPLTLVVERTRVMHNQCVPTKPKTKKSKSRPLSASWDVGWKSQKQIYADDKKIKCKTTSTRTWTHNFLCIMWSTFHKWNAYDHFVIHFSRLKFRKASYFPTPSTQRWHHSQKWSHMTHIHCHTYTDEYFDKVNSAYYSMHPWFGAPVCWYGLSHTT